jgi:hypothetical protein
MASGLASAEHTKPRPCFGRRADLAYLLSRSTTAGLTAVLGPAQVGKTTLLGQARDRLRDEGFVVGYAESTGDHRDPLLRALKDAYAHAAATDEPSVLLDNANDNRGVVADVSVPVLAAVLPGELQEILHLAKPAAVEAGSIGLDPPRLTCDEALSLTALLATVSRQPIALFLDAWEKCSPVDEAGASLRCFLDQADRRPVCHVFLGVGTDGESGQGAKAGLVDLAGGSPAAELRELGGMDLRDADESRRLLGYLADEVPVTRGIEPALTLRLLDGRPSVLHRWVTMKPDQPDALAQLADDARLRRYPELHARFLGRCRSALRIACFLAALAILPQLNDESVWRPLSLVLLKDLGPETVGALQADGFLEAVDGADGVPSYGHDTRHDAARRAWLSADEPILRPIARSEIKWLIPALAEHVTDLGTDSAVFAAALASILEQQADLQLKGGLLLLCEYAASLFASSTASLDFDVLGAKAAATVRDHPQATTLVALALADIQYVAGRQGDRTCGDALLEDLRRLCARHPDDAAIRERLAVALVNSARQASQEGDRVRRDDLLKELSRLCARHVRDATVRERLATALVSAASHASRQRDWLGRDVSLNGLRRLYAEHPGDPTVRQRLAMALVDAADQAFQQGPRANRTDLLEELRKLCAEHPGDTAVRERLATALVNNVNQACREGHPACRDSLLEELRRLHAVHPADAAVRERLATALVSAMNRAVQEEHPAWRDALLRELRALATEHPEDGPVRERLAVALYTTVVHIHHGKDRASRDTLLDELRELCADHPEDAVLHERLTMALFNMPTLLPADRD